MAATAGASGKLAQLAKSSDAPVWSQPSAIGWFTAHVAANAAMTVCFLRALQHLPSVHATVTSIAANILLTVRQTFSMGVVLWDIDVQFSASWRNKTNRKSCPPECRVWPARSCLPSRSMRSGCAVRRSSWLACCWFPWGGHCPAQRPGCMAAEACTQTSRRSGCACIRVQHGSSSAGSCCAAGHGQPAFTCRTAELQSRDSLQRW